MSATIADAITALQGRVADAYTAVSEKGGTLPATQNTANLPTAIASIPAGGGADDSINLINTLTSSVFANTDFHITDMSKAKFTTIADKVFLNCAKMVGELKLPNTVTSIGREAFHGTGINKLVLPPLVTSIPTELIMATVGDEDFEFICNDVVTKINSYGLAHTKCRKLDMPDTVTSIGERGFANNGRLETVVIRAVTPPTLGANGFTSCANLTAIYVPDASVDAYKAATNWSEKASIIKPLSEYE